MKQQILLALPLLGAVVARPTITLRKREVPQEHAHQNVLDIIDPLLASNNPDNIQASVFGLLGAKAAAAGAGNIADADCLQQATADQAFTNAKDAGDVNGMTFALIYRALERNTGSVGLASVPCASIKAVNPEIAALQQHQDPAGDGAIALNKEIALELARQIASIGGDPLQALEASTFAPGQIGDPTAAGNTCDDENDKAGCINSQNLRVDDASQDEILAAVQDGAGAGIAAGNATGNANEQAGNANGQAGNATGNANEQAGNANGQAGNADEQAANSCANQEAADNSDANSNAQNATAGAGAASGAGEFGACDPTIVFGTPSDGRQEDAFEAKDLATFNHGSALNIGVISDFICSQLPNKCDVSDQAVSDCEAASTAAKALKGQAAADAFNSALGL